MAGHYDLGNSMPFLAEALGDYRAESGYEVYHQEEPSEKTTPKHTRAPIHSTFFEVRNSICVTGLHWGAIAKVKRHLSELSNDPIAYESFHVKNVSDVKDGAYLVPKIVLVAMHCPGKKLVDEDGDEGQLDFLYDEACEVGADIMVIYMGLPKSLYPPLRHITYHPRMAEIVFPNQPLLRYLASEHCLITVTDGANFTQMQNNLLREWISKPVAVGTHPVYKAADFLSSIEYSMSEAEFYSESEVVRYKPPKTSEDSFEPATEEHPLADERPKKKKRRSKDKSKGPKSLFKRRDTASKATRDSILVPLRENDELQTSIEMDMYRNTGYPMDSYGSGQFSL